jgi:Ca2+-binding EF-hand superfamily protein
MHKQENQIMVSDFKKRKLANLFKMYDRDNSQFLEAKDFTEGAERYARRLGIEPESVPGKKLLEIELKIWNNIKRFDTDGDDKVNLEEYAEGYQFIVNQGKLNLILSAFVETLFSILDKDGDGRLSEQEFALLFVTDEGSEIFKKFDTKGTGSLSKDEILHHLTVFYTSENPSEPGNSFFGTVE